MSNEDDVRLSGYYNAYNVESTEDADHGYCTLVEIINDDKINNPPMVGVPVFL